VKTSITERQAGEGRIMVGTSADNRTAFAVEVNCNTDFTAKSDVVTNIMKAGIEKLRANPSADLKNDPQIQQMLTAAAQQTGENVQLGQALSIAAPTGRAGAYLYTISNKIAVLLGLSGSNIDDDLIKQLGGHVAFARPIGLTREAVPADVVAKEREIAVDQAKATGKPQQIAEKIAEGKLNSFFAERVLLDQEFFNPAVHKGSVSSYLKSKGAALEKYVRIEVGQR
jgi:elongation factor Ts